MRLNGREITALILSGACDGLAPLAAAGYPFAHEAALELLRKESEISALDRLELQGSVAVAAKDSQVKLYQSLMRVRNELRYLGMHLHAHPMALLRAEAERYGCLTLRDAAFSRTAGSALATSAVIIAAMRRVATGRGPMQFLTLEDRNPAFREAAVRPPVYGVREK